MAHARRNDRVKRHIASSAGDALAICASERTLSENLGISPSYGFIMQRYPRRQETPAPLTPHDDSLPSAQAPPRWRCHRRGDIASMTRISMCLTDNEERSAPPAHGRREMPVNAA